MPSEEETDRPDRQERKHKHKHKERERERDRGKDRERDGGRDRDTGKDTDTRVADRESSRRSDRDRERDREKRDRRDRHRDHGEDRQDRRADRSTNPASGNHGAERRSPVPAGPQDDSMHASSLGLPEAAVEAASTATDLQTAPEPIAIKPNVQESGGEVSMSIEETNR